MKPKGKEKSKGKGKGGATAAPTCLTVPVNPAPVDPAPADFDTAVAGPSHSITENLKKIRSQKAKTKAVLAKLAPELKKDLLARKRHKETERCILPDAPPRKRKPPKPSPKRADCRLVPGTPSIPPPPKLRPWEYSPQPLQRAPKQPLPSKQVPQPQYCPPSPASVMSLDSTLEVPGFSPYTVDWSTGNLKTDHREGVSQTAPASLSQPSCSTTDNRLIDHPVPKKSRPTAVSPATMSQPSSSFSRHQPPKPKQQVMNLSDLQTDAGRDLLNEWNLYLDKESDNEIEDVDIEEEPVYSKDVDFSILEPACVDENLGAELQEWLAKEDGRADQLVRELLPVDQLEFEWSADPSTFQGQQEEFTGQPGPTFVVGEDTRPVDVFLKFFDDELLDILIRQTNRYATVKIDRGLTEHSRLNFWKNTDRAEMGIFLSILVFQGLAPLSVESEFWKENGYLTLKYFKNLMQYNRFVLLKRLLHFTDEWSLTGQNMTVDEIRLQKIAPVLDLLNSKFSSLYYPSRDVAVDESLLKWHGRLGFVQKISTKAAKAGIKSYELCESATGYLWSFFVYTGRQDKTKKQDKDDVDKDKDEEAADPQTDQGTDVETEQTTGLITDKVASQIVDRLARSLYRKGHAIIMDNFYNSPLLARYLKCNGTDCFGTLRLNREFVPDSIKSVTKRELRVGEYLQSYCRDMSVTVWRDANIASTISTFHKGDVGGKEKYGRYKPQVILDYNLAMGGVDKKDQLLSAYPIERCRNVVWYKKVFRRMLNVTILNSYIIFKTNKSITHRAFRVRLAEELIQMFKTPIVEYPINVTCKPGPSGRPKLTGNHFIGTGKTKYARCAMCCKSRTKYICKQCNVSLCLEICFETYHC